MAKGKVSTPLLVAGAVGAGVLVVLYERNRTSGTGQAPAGTGSSLLALQQPLPTLPAPPTGTTGGTVPPVTSGGTGGLKGPTGPAFKTQAASRAPGRVSLPASSISPVAYTSPVSLPSGPSGPVPSGPAVANIFRALTGKGGLTPVQASGVLGNIQNETNPAVRGLFGAVENTSGDSGSSWGLIQWRLPGLRSTFIQQEGVQPVTGNFNKDYSRQINAIIKTFRSQNIRGSTASEVAGNWASQVENCQGCGPGGSENVARQANAAAIYQQYLRGAFNAPKPTPKILGIGPGGKVTPPGRKQIAGLFPIIKPPPVRHNVPHPHAAVPHPRAGVSPQSFRFTRFRPRPVARRAPARKPAPVFGRRFI